MESRRPRWAPGRTALTDLRARSIRRYGFAVPDPRALDTVRRYAPRGVVEIGAGTGYWAWLLGQVDVDVIAYDIDPAPSATNQWFAGTTPWHPVHRGDHHHAARHSTRTLLLVWPTRNEIWPLEAIDDYLTHGGTCVVYVGEAPGGSTGDDAFQARLGLLRWCRQCTRNNLSAPCICYTEQRWRLVESVRLPHWPGHRDKLHVLVPTATPSGDTAGRQRPDSAEPPVA